MAIFVMTTALGAVHTTAVGRYRELADVIDERAKKACPSLKWKEHYAVLGPFDYLDIFEAPDIEAAMKVAAAVREDVPADIRIWPAKQWKDYKEFIEDAD